MADLQNATYKVIVSENTHKTNMFTDYLNSGKVDISLNTAMFNQISNQRHSKRVNTFVMDGFCALVPKNDEKLPFLLIFKPFKAWIWAWMVISAVACKVFFVVVKRIFPASKYFSVFFAFIASFYGQPRASSQQNRSQKILLQFVVVSNFFLSMAFQSFIIGSMVRDCEFRT